MLLRPIILSTLLVPQIIAVAVPQIRQEPSRIQEESSSSQSSSSQSSSSSSASSSSVKPSGDSSIASQPNPTSSIPSTPGSNATSTSSATTASASASGTSGGDDNGDDDVIYDEDGNPWNGQNDTDTINFPTFDNTNGPTADPAFVADDQFWILPSKEDMTELMSDDFEYSHRRRRGRRADPPSSYFSLADVDKCNMPSRDKYRVKAWPKTSKGEYEQEPDIRHWIALSMDAWLKDLFDNCPAAVDTRTTSSMGTQRVAFSEVLGRLMIGVNKNSAASPICHQFRCQWQDTTDVTWSRGQMFGPFVKPQITDATIATVDFEEQYRRWYAMQALTNIWDVSPSFHLDHRAISAAMSSAQTIITARLPTFLNTWMPTYKGPKAPPGNKLADLLDVCSAIANFVPFGTVAAAVLQSTKIFIVDEATQRAKETDNAGKAGSKIDIGAAGAAIIGNNEEERKKATDAVIKSRKSAADTLGKVFALGSTVQNLIISSSSTATKGSYDPTVPVSWATMSEKLGTIFGEMAITLDNVASQSLNGDPKAANGYLTLVAGGLYSEWPTSTDALNKLALEETLPSYIAWLEDKLLQFMLRSRGYWLWRRVAASESECKAYKAPVSWTGVGCIKNDYGQWVNIVPVTSRLGENGPRPTGQIADFWEKPYTVNYASQPFPVLTTDSLSKLRGPTSSSFKTSLDEIYRGAERCFHQSRNGELFDHSSPVPRTDGTSPLNLWPREWYEPGKPSQTPLANNCHWSIPVVDTTKQNAASACLANYNVGGRAWDFRGDVPTEGKCDIFAKGYGIIKYGFYKNIKKHRVGYYAPGPAMWYGRALVYPESKECALGSSASQGKLECPEPPK